MITRLINNKRVNTQFFRVKTQNIRQVIQGNIAEKTHKKHNKMRTTNLLNTNTKKYKENISIEIFKALDDCGDTHREKLQTMVDRFDKEFNYKNNQLRYPNLQDRFADWLQGGAIDLPLYYYDITKMARRVHETALFTDKEVEKIHENFYNHMAVHCLRLATEYKINLNNLYN
jgi:hypothetical protein